MTRKILSVGTVFLVSILSVLVVFLISWRALKANGGFTRDVIDTQGLELLSKIDLQLKGYYFAGQIGKELYFGFTTLPFHLLKVTDSTKEVIQIKHSKEDSVRTSKILIEYPHFYLADLEHYNIYRGETTEWSYSKLVHHSSFFTEYLPVNYSVFLRLFNDTKTEFILAKETSGNLELDGARLLEKQIDGIFCTDGVLKYDHASGILVYTYYYRNQFICADTSLRLIFRGNTIDTTRFAKMAITNEYLSGYSTMSSPPRIVNRRAYVTNNLLFVNSNIKADNENQETFESMNVLDVYNLTTGKYLNSAYIPRISTSKLRHFFVIDDVVYSIQEQYLLLHKLKLKKSGESIDFDSLSPFLRVPNDHDLHRPG